MADPPTNSSVLNETLSSVISGELPTIHRGRGTMDGPGDAVWILTSAFIIFTMISGFGLVESGRFILGSIPETCDMLIFFLRNCFVLYQSNNFFSKYCYFFYYLHTVSPYLSHLLKSIAILLVCNIKKLHS